MKKLGTFLILMSLGLFTIGCAKKDAGTSTEAETPAAENGDGAADGNMEEGSADGADAGATDAAAGEGDATE